MINIFLNPFIIHTKGYTFKLELYNSFKGVT